MHLKTHFFAFDPIEISPECRWYTVFVQDLLPGGHDEGGLFFRERIGIDLISPHLPDPVREYMPGIFYPADPQRLHSVFSQPLQGLIRIQGPRCVRELIKPCQKTAGRAFPNSGPAAAPYKEHSQILCFLFFPIRHDRQGRFFPRALFVDPARFRQRAAPAFRRGIRAPGTPSRPPKTARPSSTPHLSPGTSPATVDPFPSP